MTAKLDHDIDHAENCYRNFCEQSGWWGKLWYFYCARCMAKHILTSIKGFGVLSAMQCHLLGTIMAKQHLLWRRKTKLALDLLAAGLDKDPPPHLRAMIEMARAEAYLSVGQREMTRMLVGEAVALAPAVWRESDKAHARSEYTYVLTCALDFYTFLNDTDVVVVQEMMAWCLANEEDPSRKEQMKKIINE